MSHCEKLPTDIQLLEYGVYCSSGPIVTPSHFCLWGWMKSEDYKRKADTPDELLARSSGSCCPHN